VAAFVEPDRGELLGVPGFGGVEGEGAGREGLVGVAAAWEREACAAGALVEAVGEEFAVALLSPSARLAEFAEALADRLLLPRGPDLSLL
jgi:hypothetical protein